MCTHTQISIFFRGVYKTKSSDKQRLAVECARDDHEYACGCMCHLKLELPCLLYEEWIVERRSDNRRQHASYFFSGLLKEEEETLGGTLLLLLASRLIKNCKEIYKLSVTLLFKINKSTILSAALILEMAR